MNLKLIISYLISKFSKGYYIISNIPIRDIISDINIFDMISLPPLVRRNVKGKTGLPKLAKMYSS